ncbi:MAG: potassium channel protein [Candidatus Syntrophoarchaeum caldarius]|uniref:Potassium channel protein n=1 Tax=Candidatus Syntropharchaeum caldarium TaxID=1838285 RepID=A0A1F2PC65_9EURY|nr:MAG: potassium channel protein [Candidatus Syntrophoarchaeum caldarius]
MKDDSGDRPTNAKEVLVEMKDISELMLDLAYSAVIFGDAEIADEVMKLEEEMDDLLYRARISIMLGARSVDDANKLSGVLQIASAAEKISNAAADIAKLVLVDSRTSNRLKHDIQSADETITSVKVYEGSKLDSRTLGDLQLETETGMRVIAIKRGHKWIYAPERDTVIFEGDILLARGPPEGIQDIRELAGCKPGVREEKVISTSKKLNAAISLIIEMKDLSELIVGLAYSAVLFYSNMLASEVKILEEKMDEMLLCLETTVLEAAKEVEDISEIQGIIPIGISTEIISDAAYEIADIVLREIELHPVFMLAIRESDEVVSKVDLRSGVLNSDGKPLDIATVEDETGMYVMAVRRGNDRWIYDPDPDLRLKGGEALIVRGTRSGEERLIKLWGIEPE